MSNRLEQILKRHRGTMDIGHQNTSSERNKPIVPNVKQENLSYFQSFWLKICFNQRYFQN